MNRVLLDWLAATSSEPERKVRATARASGRRCHGRCAALGRTAARDIDGLAPLAGVATLPDMFEPSRIFISYRRSDSEKTALGLCLALRRRFGDDRVFFDSSDIPYGEDFRVVIEGRIASSDVVLPIVGPTWLSVRNAHGRRLDQPDDPVRFEIETALALKKRIVPVRIDGAAAPSSSELPPSLHPLAFANAPEVRTASFDIDVEELVRQLLGAPRLEVGTLARLRAAMQGGPVVAAVLVVALLLASFTGLFNAFGLGTAAQRMLLSAAPAPAGEPVLLVGIDAASERALRRFGADTAPAWRRDHARLVERAASAGALAVVFDLSFKPSPAAPAPEHAGTANALAAADAVLADAARRAEHGTPPMRVVFGVREMDGAVPALSGPLLQAARWGSLCLYRVGEGALWSVALAVLRPASGRAEETTAADTPALALSAVVGERLIEADGSDRELRFDGPTRDPPVRYSTVERQRQGAGPCALTVPGDDLLMARLRVAPAGYWRDPRRSVSYAGALDREQTPDSLFAGRIVLVGLTAVEGPGAQLDTQTVIDGFTPRSVFGVELHADAIRELATGHVPRLPTLDRQLWISLLACALGGSVAVRLFDAPAWRRRGVLAAAVAAWLLAAWWLARRDLMLDVVNDAFAIVLSAVALRALQVVAWRFRAFRRISS